MWRTEKRHPSRMLLVASGKQVCLWPLTIYVFQDSVFAGATVTNVITEGAQEHNPMPPLTPAIAAPALTAVAMVTAQEHNPRLCHL